jgi:MFS family permease
VVVLSRFSRYFRRNTAATAAKRESIYTPSILLLALTIGVSYLGLGFVTPLRALYSQQVGATPGEIGLMTSAAMLTGFLAAPPIGWLTDRFGSRTLLWVALLAHGVLTLSYAFVQNPVALIGLRALEGVAIVGVLPPARALMNRFAPKTRQGEALGLLSSAQMTGILLGPALGTLLANQVGYVPAFLVASVPLFMGALAARLALPGRPQPFATTDPVAASANIEPLRERTSWRAQFTSQLWLVYALAAVVGWIPTGLGAIWSLYMVARGSSLPVVGLSFTAFALPMMLLTPLAGRFSDRRGRYGPILGSFAFYTVVLFLFGLPLAPLWLVALSAIEGVVMAVVGSSISGFLADVMPSEGRGKAQANYSAAMMLGGFLGATAAGFLYAISPGAPFFAWSAICVLVSIALCLPPLVRLIPANRQQISIPTQLINEASGAVDELAV